MMFFCLASSGTLLSLGHQPIELIPWEKLVDFIVEISGWTKKGDLEGSQVEAPPKSQVIQGYVSTDGNRSLEIHIFDSAKSMIVLMPIKMMMRDGKTPQGFTEKITIHGFPGVKTYDYTQKKAGLIVLILDRFVLQMYGHNFTEAEGSELVEVAENHDLNRMAELAK
jgi:hypothetical protein